MKMQITHLERIMNTNVLRNPWNNTLETLLNSVNDWPNSVNTLEDFESQIENTIKGPICKKNIEEYLKNVDYSLNAWESESLFVLLGIYDNHSAEECLKDIIYKLSIEIQRY